MVTNKMNERNIGSARIANKSHKTLLFGCFLALSPTETQGFSHFSSHDCMASKKYFELLEEPNLKKFCVANNMRDFGKHDKIVMLSDLLLSVKTLSHTRTHLKKQYSLLFLTAKAPINRHRGARRACMSSHAFQESVF